MPAPLRLVGAIDLTESAAGTLTVSIGTSVTISIGNEHLALPPAQLVEPEIHVPTTASFSSRVGGGGEMRARAIVSE